MSKQKKVNKKKQTKIEQDAFSFLSDHEPPTRKDLLSNIIGQLVYVRRKNGLTLAMVNDRIGVADRLVNKWECGLKSPTAFNLYCWAEVLGGVFVFVPYELEEQVRNTVKSHYDYH